MVHSSFSLFSFLFLYIEIFEMNGVSFVSLRITVEVPYNSSFFYLHRDYKVTDVSLAGVAAIEVALRLA